jgi:protein gp37
VVAILMADTHIEWTQRVWNATTGCDRVSAGCDHCYALTMAKRLKGMGQAKYQKDGDPRTSGPGFGLTVHEDVLTQPLRWRKPSKVFVNSMSDLFHAEVPDEFLAKVFAVMAAAPQHTFQILTKRHARMRSLLNSSGFAVQVAAECARLWNVDDVAPLRGPLPNVWLGVSCEDQRWADLRIPALLDTPAAVRWVSAEPLLNPVGLRPGQWIPPLEGGPRVNLNRPWEEPGPTLDWVVAGGESGTGARRLGPGWIRHLVDECQSTGTPIFVKQMGSVWASTTTVAGKTVAAHGDPKGGDPQWWPADIRVREFPQDAVVAS